MILQTFPQNPHLLLKQTIQRSGELIELETGMVSTTGRSGQCSVRTALADCWKVTDRNAIWNRCRKCAAITLEPHRDAHRRAQILVRYENQKSHPELPTGGWDGSLRYRHPPKTSGRLQCRGGRCRGSPGRPSSKHQPSPTLRGMSSVTWFLHKASGSCAWTQA
jgi:hypothetical protein